MGHVHHAGDWVTSWFEYAYLLLSMKLATDSFLVIWTFLPSNVAGRTKKTVTSTVLFVAYCVGNSIGAQIMQPSDAPKYIRGITICGILYGVEFCSMAAWRFYCEFKSV